MSRHSNKSHIARAVLEAVAYQTNELLNAIATDLGEKLSIISVDGGMVNNNLLMQFQADISQIQVQSHKISEITAYGAGLASYVHIKKIPLDSISRSDSKSLSWNPNMNDNIRTNYLSKWDKAVEKAKNWI